MIFDHLKKKSGIYMIKNIANGRYYIGASKNIYQRCNEHLRKLKSGLHQNNNILEDFIKYGEEAFFFLLVEEVDNEKLNIKEKEWFERIKVADKKIPYNIRSNPYTFTKDVRKKISDFNRKKSKF